ncbi:bifunctional 3-phosphoshikimate 1-carboxyvinyltransferase/cytidylate kinase [Tibeticola sp.]|jgi:3-phosphoshikimate 1-carboxyvinyltransferase|uniref:bifunctional 3-phosphoshikimate 1-carboxyvinyltransferase/cytidylate kinase n=1 Tax=Tibeticola sp. TaxID=2005368 RepID=UPI0025904A09|nr:bifunctional 3-phosphoshikimate 1-carboxyvinyltransferase/cytidylate kinase [Tibeticola sp.]MCI4440701.1 bifunctional 3-phosphoshikimate 1-carboxyvinyltransferase/cytidylate kinase [Tibeticola sp.]
MYTTEFLDLPPLRSAGGTVQLPGSKSISNRVLLLAALSAGTTRIRDLLDSDDTRVMLDALRTLGCGVEAEDAHTVRVTGLGGQAPRSPAKLFLGNAGTAMRPLTAALAVLGGDFELSGVPRMHERPIADLVDALRQIGCSVEYLGQEGYPPLRIGRPRARQVQQPIRVRGDVSSQFLTALLLAAPLLSTESDVVFEVTGTLISRPYIEITLNLLERFGVQVRREGWSRFTVPAASAYRTPGEIHVEADASSASYFIALGAIAATAERPVHIQGVGAASIQGDIRFVDAARLMGAQVESGPNDLRVSRGAWPLRSIDLDCIAIPDAAMTLAVLALFADGPSTLRNIGSWRVKETDRIAAMAQELRRLGARVEEGADLLRVHPLAEEAWRAACIRTYDDHRMAMCFSLAAFNPAAQPVRILDPKCVAKTFPDYFETLFQVVEAQPGAIPVLCIDGPTASGKGTLAAALAERLGYHWLDSGALYRLTALAAQRAGLAVEEAQTEAIAALARALDVEFQGERVLLRGEDVSADLRTEAIGRDASKVAAWPAVRAALLQLQRDFRRLPGLVADGRDMGTVVFPDATLKVFLTASAEQRAERRYKQLISKGVSTTLDAVLADLQARDARDMSRSAAPLKPADDALLLDNSTLTVEASVERVLAWWQERLPFGDCLAAS